ncbi:hypothetical protein [Staphylococcus kloosii]|jgi:hypothetical protein|uniref:hypothetical protein n=1 Tax=Staphylococcus kloosii TaxID=29384 RepID=UPI00189E4A4B|nr:hypothetical protein [Staphylococcus kloosii]MBF7026033.1 hypothetical protein [Staphylococcus kloosii]
MSKEFDYIILKLSDKEIGIPFSDDEKLLERANGNWRLTPAKLGKAKKALLLFRGQVLNEYEVGSKIIFDRDNTRITFDMKTIDNSNYKGKVLNYKTPNPASIISKSDLDKRIKK